MKVGLIPRLEKKTENGTWEFVQQLENIKMTIWPHQTLIINNAQQHHWRYYELPVRTYRWVISMNPDNQPPFIIFSPQFWWDGKMISKN
jgi:hypothetical protein